MYFCGESLSAKRKKYVVSGIFILNEYQSFYGGEILCSSVIFFKLPCAQKDPVEVKQSIASV